MADKVFETKDDKCWVTVSYNANLGNFENIKIEAGYSQTLPPNRSPIDFLEDMQDTISNSVIEEVKALKKQLKKKRSSKWQM